VSANETPFADQRRQRRQGSLVGWRHTVSLEAVSGLDAALASTRLDVPPHPTTLVAGTPADVVRSSPRACVGPDDRVLG
jgi:hypothetical protein